MAEKSLLGCPRLLGSIVLSFAVFSFVNAEQTRTTEPIAYPKRVVSRYEFLIGPNLIYARGSDFLKDARVGKFGFRSTLGLSHVVNSKWSMGIGISYENKGYKFEVYSENPGPPATDMAVTDVTLNYVTATFLPRYTVVPSRKLEVGVGPYFGYLASTRLVQKQFFEDNLVSKFSSRPDPGIDYKEFDWGISFIICTNLPIKERKGVCIQLLYSLGIAEINKPTIDQIKNNTFSLLVGFCIERNTHP